jgi:effector-binding domain-containing protein
MTRIFTIIALLFATPAWAEYERPSYNVVLKEDGLEIRDYAPAIVVETQVLASRRDAAGEAFRSLFKYISGNNASSLEIPMTSPVAQTAVSKGSNDVSDKWTIRFFLPSNLSVENIPQPLQQDVNIVTLAAQRFASVSFKGTQNDKKVSKYTARLREFISQKGYGVSGEPVYAFYDPFRKSHFSDP